jgi:hypothetical protein
LLRVGTDLQDFSANVLKALLPRAPSRVELGKWTKVDDALAFHVLSSVGNLFEDLCKHSLTSLHLERHVGVEGELSEAMMLDISWHRVAGKNYVRAMKSLRDSHDAIILALLVETTRELHSTFMTASFDFDGMAVREESIGSRPHKEQPMLLDLLNPAFSMPFQLLQYWSTVARHPAAWSRISLLIVRYGAVDYRDWTVMHPDAVDTLSRAILALMAAIRRRLWRNLVQDKEIFVLSDERISMEERERVSRRLVRQNPCCRALGMHREFLRCLQLPARLDAESNSAILMQSRSVIFLVAIFTLLSIACLERLHSLSRRLLLASRTTFYLYSGTFAVARRSENFLRAQAYARRELKLAAAEPAPPGLLTDAFPANEIRYASSEFQIFKARYLAVQSGDLQSDGKRLNPILHGDLIRQAFVNAAPREKLLCSKLSRWHGVLAADAKALRRLDTRPVDGVADAAAPGEMLAIEWRVGEMHASPVDQSMVVYRTRAEIRSADTLSIFSAPAGLDICNASVPWTRQHMDDYREGHGIFDGMGPKKKMDAQSELKRLTNPCAGAEAPAFPLKSERPPCGEMCANASHPAHLSFYRRIKSALACIAGTCAPKAKAALVSSTDCLLAIDGAGRATAFYRLSDAKARHAQHEAVQELIALDAQPPNASSPWHGVKLTACRSAFISPAPDHFEQNIFAEAICGDHVAITGDRLASNMTRFQHLDISVLEASPLRMDSLDCWIVSGVKRLWQLGDTCNPAPMACSDGVGQDSEMAEEGLGELPSAFDKPRNVGTCVLLGGDMDPLEEMLSFILEGEIAEGLSLIELHRAASASEEAEILELDVEHGRAKGGGASSSSGSIMALGATADIDAVIENACHGLQLDRRHGAGLFVFSDSSTPLLDTLVIHRVRDTLRGTCKARGHGKCCLWLSTDVTEPATFVRVLLAVLRWGAAGRDAGEQEHFRLAMALKREFGMKV